MPVSRKGASCEDTCYVAWLDIWISDTEQGILALRKRHGSVPAFLQFEQGWPFPGSPLQRIFRLRHLWHFEAWSAGLLEDIATVELTATAIRFLGGADSSRTDSGILLTVKRVAAWAAARMSW